MPPFKFAVVCLIVLACFMAFTLAVIAIALGNPSVQRTIVELVQVLSSIR